MSKTRQIVALLLLAWAMVDLGVPGLCASDALPLPSAGTVATRRGDAIFIQATTPHSPARESFEDDCFCCCSHIVPTVAYTFSAIRTTEAQAQIATLPPAYIFPVRLFRPPRN